MSTLGELRAHIQSTLQDSSFSEESLDLMINEALHVVAASVKLPELESTGTVTASPLTSSVEIPSDWDFSREFYSCKSTARDIRIYTAMSSALLDVPDFESTTSSGEICAAVMKGSYLYYYPMPTKETTLRCSFYRNPTELVNDDDEPSCVPRAFQRPLLAGYVLWKLFTLIEDGVEGRKTNSTFYKGEFYEALEQVDISICHGQSRFRPVRTSQFL